MTASQFFWLGMGGCLLLTLASLGTKVLYEIPWHELKDYCRRRNERQRFDKIHDGHDEVTLGMETLRCLASVMLMIAAAGYIAHWHRETPLSSSQAWAWSGGLLAVVLVRVRLAASCLGREVGRAHPVSFLATFSHRQLLRLPALTRRDWPGNGPPPHVESSR